MPKSAKHHLMRLAQYNGVNGTCWDAPSNLERLNEVREMIYESGPYEGTIEFLVCPVDGGRLFLPEAYDGLKTLSACHRPIELQGRNYEVVDIGLARNLAFSTSHQSSNLVFRELNQKTPFYRKVRFPINFSIVNDDEEDNGTEIGFEYIKGGTKVFKKIKLDGREGVNFPESVDDVVSVIKPVTKGNIHLWSEHGIQLAEYSSWNDAPRFTSFDVYGCPPRCLQVVACARKKCIPITDVDQPVEFDSSQALKFGYLAMNAQQADDPNKFAANAQLMLKSLSIADLSLKSGEPSVAANVHYAQEDNLGPGYGRC